MKLQLTLTGNNLQFQDIYNVAHSDDGQVKISLAPLALEKVVTARNFILQKVEEGRPIYGINTGFGALSDKRIASEDLKQLQLNLIRSHATGVGRYFSRPITRAIMLLRANCLASGHSGASPAIFDILFAFLHHGITPLIPEKGSVGASGDLAPLSHLALALIGEGMVDFQQQHIPAREALAKIGHSAIELGPKDGLALINGTAVMTALGALAVCELDSLTKLADIAAAMTLEGLMGTKKAYHPLISQVKPHPGQLACSANLNRLLENSLINHSHTNCGKVQDPYSLRCVPQVHGACRQTLIHAQEILATEINAVTDNPLVFVATEEVLSGGNFHGEAVSLVMDYLTIGVAELCSIAERRIEKMMNPTFSQLPAFLAKQSGLHSGLMIAHVTAAALASENKYLAHPASVDSIPTSTDKEDHVSMGVTAGRKLHEVLFNAKNCLAIEFLCNSQAIEFHRPLTTSAPLEAALAHIRSLVPTIDGDRIFAEDIKAIYQLINDGSLLRVVESAIGHLA